MDKISELAKVAGIPKSNGLVQSLNYSDDWMKEEYKLLELPNKLIDVFKDEQVFRICGDSDDNVVICTQDQTFDLKAADTSNALLLVPELKTPLQKNLPSEVSLEERSVCSCFSTYYEVRQTRPKLERLRHLLDENAFSDIAESEEKFTTDNLLSLIQASRIEILTHLERLGAFQHNGYWLILEITYQEKVFSQILALLEEKSWNWTHVPIQDTIDVLEELYPRFVLEYCLNHYGVLEADGKIICLDEVKVCRYYAEYILRPAVGKFNYNEFMDAWRESVPDGMKVSTEYLQGVALMDLTSYPPVIWHFAERNLPEEPSERFTILFKARSKWKHANLEPYIKNLLAPGQKLSALLLKYTRSSNDEHGEKLYNSKQPIS